MLRKQSSVTKEATTLAALWAEKSNTVPKNSGTPAQNPSTSADVGSMSEWRPGKNYERNQRRKQRKKLLKGLKGITLTNPGDDLTTSSKLCIHQKVERVIKHSIDPNIKP